MHCAGHMRRRTGQNLVQTTAHVGGIAEFLKTLRNSLFHASGGYGFGSGPAWLAARCDSGNPMPVGNLPFANAVANCPVVEAPPDDLRRGFGWTIRIYAGSGLFRQNGQNRLTFVIPAVPCPRDR